VIVAEGYSGIGKSMLIAEISRLATDVVAQNVTILTGKSFPYECYTPYFAFRSVVSTLFELGT
jgi:hypothetical protein